MSNQELYDAIIVGGGPSGLTAALYLARARYRVLVIEKDRFGGQITITHEVVNYPGVEKTSGEALTETMRRQAQNFGAEFLLSEVTDVSLEGDIKSVTTSRGVLRAFPCEKVLGLLRELSLPFEERDFGQIFGLRPASPAGKPPAGIRHEQQNDIYPKVTPRAYKATQSPRTPKGMHGRQHQHTGAAPKNPALAPPTFSAPPRLLRDHVSWLARHFIAGCHLNPAPFKFGQFATRLHIPKKESPRLHIGIIYPTGHINNVIIGILVTDGRQSIIKIANRAGHTEFSQMTFNIDTHLLSIACNQGIGILTSCHRLNGRNGRIVRRAYCCFHINKSL